MGELFCDILFWMCLSWGINGFEVVLFKFELGGFVIVKVEVGGFIIIEVVVGGLNLDYNVFFEFFRGVDLRFGL